MCYAELEEEGLSASAVEKLSKLKVFQHLRERHKTQQNRVQLPSICAVFFTLVLSVA